MNESRIVELLRPFVGLAPPVSSKLPSQFNFEDDSQPPVKQNICQSEPGQAREEPSLLSPEQLQRISTYVDILIRWNARVNLTAIRDPGQIITRHFGESLFAAARLFPRDARVGTAALGCPAERSSAALTVADLGSGAGFPGLPLKLWAPQISLTLIESNHKKAAFLREVVRALTLTDVDVFSGRAESLIAENPIAKNLIAKNLIAKNEDVRRTFDVVTLRAVERFESILPVAASLVAPAGRLALLIGANQALKATGRISFQWQEPIPVPCSEARILLIGRSLAQ